MIKQRQKTLSRTTSILSRNDGIHYSRQGMEYNGSV